MMITRQRLVFTTAVIIIMIIYSIIMWAWYDGQQTLPVLPHVERSSHCKCCNAYIHAHRMPGNCMCMHVHINSTV